MIPSFFTDLLSDARSALAGTLKPPPRSAPSGPRATEPRRRVRVRVHYRTPDFGVGTTAVTRRDPDIDDVPSALSLLRFGPMTRMEAAAMAHRVLDARPIRP
jgi:hypothetical protein